MVRPSYDSLILLEAARHGDEPTVLAQLETGCCIYARDEDGNTPLHLAARYGHEGVVAHLLSSQAPMNLVNTMGHTPLMVAAFFMHRRIVERMLVFIRECRHRTTGEVLRAAQAFGLQDLLTVTAASMQHSAEIIGVRVVRGALRALRIGCPRGNRELSHLRLLLDREPDGERRQQLSTLLDVLESCRHLSRIEVINECPVAAGTTALGCAINHPHYDADCVRLLLQHGALSSPPSARPRTRLPLAGHLGHIIHDDLVRSLIGGLDLTQRDRNGNTFLHSMAFPIHLTVYFTTHPQFIEVAGTTNHQGETLLMVALRHRAMDVARRLLDLFVDVNAQDVHGRTALMLACATGCPEIVRDMINRGANPLVQDQRGLTCLG